MSVIKQRYSFVQTLLSEIGGPRTFNGEIVSGDNYRKVISGQRLFVAMFADVLHRSCVTNAYKFRRWRRLVACLNTIDVLSFFSTLDCCDDMLLANVARFDGSWTGKPDTSLEEGSAEFMKSIHALLIPIRHADASPGRKFAAYHQVFTFCKRISLDLDYLEQSAFDGWLQVEMKVWPTKVAGPEKSIISKWFPKTWDWTKDFDPKHGPGAVAECSNDVATKWSHIVEYPKIAHVMWTIGWDFHGLMQNPFVSRNAKLRWGEMPDSCSVVFVPKSWKTFRTISKEPAVLQWLQQGFGACVDTFFKKRITSVSRHYCLDTEWRNRHLARLGSFDGEWATIDLSQASDSVPWNLVCEWFSDSWLAYPVFMSRTTYAQHSKLYGQLEQDKYAPMGSRLCFPAETIVFLAIAESSCRAAGLDTREQLCYVVYGDDIVILKEAVPFYQARLKELGFKMNVTKSFFDTVGPNFFRESCGGEFFNGLEVTPIRIPRFFRGIYDTRKGWLGDPAAIASSIDLCNTCYGILPTVRLLLMQALDAAKIPILFDEDGKQGLKCENATNTHLKRRWNNDLQRWEVKCWSLYVPVKKLSWVRFRGKKKSLPPNLELESQRLFEVLRRTQHRKSLLWPEDDYRVTFDPRQKPKARYEFVDASRWFKAPP